MTHASTLAAKASKIFIALLATALVYTLGGQAQATHQPADKVAASAGIDEIAFAANGETVQLLEETFRTSTTSDLLLQVAAECAITTEITTVGNDTEAARGQLKFHMTIETAGGEPRPVGVTQESTSTTTSQDNDGGEVVFCDRKYERQTSLFDDEDATIRTFMDTRNANAFNWVELNAGKGIHTIRLYATYTEEETSADASALAAVGRRTLIVEPVKMKNDEHIMDVVVD